MLAPTEMSKRPVTSGSISAIAATASTDCDTAMARQFAVVAKVSGSWMLNTITITTSRNGRPKRSASAPAFSDRARRSFPTAGGGAACVSGIWFTSLMPRLRSAVLTAVPFRCVRAP